MGIDQRGAMPLLDSGGGMAETNLTSLLTIDWASLIQ
jgi:hypothetical protein